MKRFVSVLLICTLISAFAAGCSQKQNNTSNAPGMVGNTQVQSESASKAEPLFKDKVTLKYMIGSHPSWPYDPNWWIWKALENETNVKFDIIAVPSANLNDKINLVMSSGDLPDIMFVNSKPLIDKYAAAGAFAEISKYITAKDMPNLYKFVNSNDSNKTWVKRFYSGDGKLYCVPNSGYGMGNNNNWMFREDIFKKHNLSIPKSYDELFQVAKRLKELYPDSYPFVFRNPFGYLYGKFSLMGNQWKTGYPYYFDDASKSWKYGLMDESFKNMIAWMSEMYKEKLVPQDILTLTAQQWEEFMSSGKSFITLDYTTRIDTFGKAVQATNPEYKLKFMPPPVGGKDGQSKIDFTAMAAVTIAITSTSKKINESVKLLDWLYSEKAKELVSWGREGETYKIENGQRKWIKQTANTAIEAAYGIASMGTYLLFDSNAFLVDASPEYIEAQKESEKYSLPMKPERHLNEEELKFESLTGEAIRKYTEQELTKFIIGQRSLSEWDKFTAEIRNLGLDKMLKIYNDSYNRIK